jgi:hypothetical protein
VSGFGDDPHIDKQITAVTTLLRATPDGQWKFFEMLFKQAFPPAQPDLFLADEIARLRIAAPDEPPQPSFNRRF